ncbi:MAG: type III-B CRISPR module RAMP protein Cmr1 [Candidatus Njordarchaeales archaeon]
MSFSRYQNIVLTLRQSTPAFIGSYEPERIDETTYLRPSSIKGIWRWFSRTLVAGMLYDQGYLIDPKVISYLVGKVMGLGYVDPDGRESEASRFILRIHVAKEPTKGSVPADSDCISLGNKCIFLQRIGLLTLRRSLEYFYNGAFTLELIKTRAYDKVGEALAIRSLILALTLSGIGKGSRRGLGSLDIINIRNFYISKEELTLSNFLERTYNMALELVRKYRDKLPLRQAKRNALPQIPVFSKGKVNDMNIFLIYKFEHVDWVKVHNFFLRSERCKVLYGNCKAQDDLRKNHEAWILGLPRSGMKIIKIKDYSSGSYTYDHLPKLRVRTGYIVKRDGERRASPIFLAYHEEHLFGKGVYLTVFVSNDWPSSIVWTNGKRTISVNIDVIRAVQDALNELWKYLGVSSPTPLWPQPGGYYAS